MRRIGSHLTYANVMVTILAFIVLTGGTAVALNGANTVQSDDLGPGAQVKAPDVAANAVNGSDVVDSSLNSVDLAPAARTRKLDRTGFPNNGEDVHLATVGPYQIIAERSSTFSTTITLYAKGPAGTADVMFDRTENDSTDLGTESHGVAITANTATEFAHISTGAGTIYRRMAGTAMLRTGGKLVQVDFNAVANNGGTSFVYGTATMGT